MEIQLFKRCEPGETYVQQLEREWAVKTTAPFNRSDPRVQFWALVDEFKADRPAFTALQVFNLARSSPRGAKLWEQMHDSTEILDAVDRAENVGKRERVEIRKEAKRMHTTTTIRDAAWACLEEGGAALQQHAPTLTKAEAIEKFRKTAEGLELVALYYDPHATLTKDEFVAKRQMLAKRRAAGFERWDQAVDQRTKLIQQRDGTDYPTALRKVAGESPAMWDCYLAEQRGA